MRGAPQASASPDDKYRSLDGLALAHFAECVARDYGLYLRDAIDAERFADCVGQEIEQLHRVFPANPENRVA